MTSNILTQSLNGDMDLTVLRVDVLTEPIGACLGYKSIDAYRSYMARIHLNTPSWT